MPPATGGPVEGPGVPELERATALHILAAWLGERFFRTFRPAADAAPFDALLAQRERRVAVTVGALWEGDALAARAFGALVGADLSAAHDTGAYALWLPPGAAAPADEPALSTQRLLIARGLAGLAPGERRELRVPVSVRLAKVDAAGAYISVAGGLSSVWTELSEGAGGAFHLDCREVHRLPAELAERALLLGHVRDRAALLEVGEVTSFELWDSWLVSRLPDLPGETPPPGLSVFAAPPEHDPVDGALLRRRLRAHVARALAQRAAGACDMSLLLLVGAIAHMSEERATAALRGMNPASYGGLDLIALTADGLVRQILQPRSLPWER